MRREAPSRPPVVCVLAVRRIVGMTELPNSDPLFPDPKRLLLDMAQEQSLPELLRLIVAGLGDSPRVALVRIWLAQPTADCTGCPTAEHAGTSPAACTSSPAADDPP